MDECAAAARVAALIPSIPIPLAAATAIGDETSGDGDNLGNSNAFRCCGLAGESLSLSVVSSSTARMAN